MATGIWVFLLLLQLIGVFSIVVLTPILVFVINGRRNKKRAVGFFHPYTNDGGGGERVLWCSVKAIQEAAAHLDCVIYTGDDASPQSLMSRALDRFGVELHYPPQVDIGRLSASFEEVILVLIPAYFDSSNSSLLAVVHLYKRKWIEERTYAHFTMIAQSLGSIWLSWEALRKFTPLFYFDTSGYAFTYPLARIFGCKVICYTHYPTISSDMVSRVRQRSSMYNNDSLIAGSIWLSRCKLIYYTLFSWMYGLVGSCAHLAMVNSSWTKFHIEKLWKIPERTRRVYPPCDTSAMQVLPLERSGKIPKFISVAQFRPEKAQALQLEAFSLAVRRLDSDSPRPKLQFVGSCRNEEDVHRLMKLKEKCIELDMVKDVEFYKDVMYRELVQLLGGAISGLHSMIDEHFGISVVEYMASGAVPIAHNSAGPKMDIVIEEDGQQTGFLASDVQEYADAMLKILKMPEVERLKIAAAARKRAERFCERKFYEDFKAVVGPILSYASQ